MSLFGKILAALNLLGAFLLIALAALDYGKRQAFAYSVLEHEALISGLPLTASDKDLEGNVRAEQLTESTRRELFAGLRTQQEAAEQVKQAADGLVNASQDKRAQALAYTRVLLPLAATNAQRERLLAVRTYLADEKARDQLRADLQRASQRAADPNREPKQPFPQALHQELQNLPGDPRTPFEEAYVKAAGNPPAKPFDQAFEAALDDVRSGLQAEYEQAFQPAVEGKYPAEGGRQLSPEERKAAVAHLLFSLADVTAEAAGGSPAEQYKRSQAVVGLEAAVREVNDQARRLGQAADDLAAAMDRERDTFAAAHRELVTQLRTRARQVEAERGVLERVRADVAHQDVLVKSRQRDLKQAQELLADLRRQTAERLAELRTMGDALVQVRLEVRRTSDENQRREQEIRKLEQRR